MTANDEWDEDRVRGGGIAGDWRSTQPRFDDPMSWSVPIGHAAGVTVRVHALFLIVIVIELVKSVIADPNTGAATPFDLPHTLGALGMLVLLVLTHEVGHVAACRRCGGDADEILLWPLGGLASCDPPRRWTAELWTALGGPLVNVGIWMVCAIVLGLTVGWKGSVLFPNPLSPAAFAQMPGRTLEALFILHWLNWVLLLLNMLPIFPLDGGQVLRALLTRTFDHIEATRAASRIGVIGAILLTIVAIVAQSWMLAAIAVFCAITCFVSLRRIDFADAMERGLEPTRAITETRDAERRAQREADQEAKRRAALMQEEARLDAILEKIGREGRQSLNLSERLFLKRATKRRRRQ